MAWRIAPLTVDEFVLLVAWLLLACAGLLLACVDVTVRRLPTPFVLATAAILAGLVGVAASTARQPWMLVNSLAASSALAGVYLLLALVGGGMGMGDVRLAAVLGLVLGTAGWTAVLLGATLPYLLAMPSAVMRLRRDPKQRHLPFGPYLVAGAILAVCLTGA
ncbi:prepilin peptidase [Plantactinospora alkalitolerans]|uniref:prepilin peptidase n=1 Tax=Plantactinospora alkalitolerans TaxID=2789879 RepID=UPI001E54DF40|nr:prepilin peptidase [Plantactinospora alkalitolerans]